SAERAADDRVRGHSAGERRLGHGEHRGRGGALEAFVARREIRDREGYPERGEPLREDARLVRRRARGEAVQVEEHGGRYLFPSFALISRQRSPSARSRPLSESFTISSPFRASGRYSSAT